MKGIDANKAPNFPASTKRKMSFKEQREEVIQEAVVCVINCCSPSIEKNIIKPAEI